MKRKLAKIMQISTNRGLLIGLILGTCILLPSNAMAQGTGGSKKKPMKTEKPVKATTPAKKRHGSSATVSSSAQTQSEEAEIEAITPVDMVEGTIRTDQENKYTETFELFYKSAEQGNPSAMYNLGWMYENGYGVPQDYNEARKWYEKASEQGDEEAQKKLQELGR